MTVARSVADVLADHVVFEVECIDRMYLNVYVPQLQYPAGLVGFVHRQLGLPIASTAPLAPISDGFSKAMRRFARDQGVPWVDFVKGQRKDDIMHQHLAGFTAKEGVLFVGRAQEKTVVFRTEKRRNAEGVAYPWIVKTTGVVNHFYVYAVDADFGPFFLKPCSYFPYNARLYPLTELVVARYVYLYIGGIPWDTLRMPLSEQDRAEFQAAVGSGSYDGSVAARAQMVLWYDEGYSKVDIAKMSGASRPTVDKWLKRYEEGGLEALVNLTSPGGPRQIPDRIRGRVLALTRTTPPSALGISHWSSSEMARYIKKTEGVYVSQTWVSRLWRENGLQPWRQGTFKISRDPHFEDKVRDVVGLYLDPPEGEVVVSVDAKSGIQALDRTQPLLPIEVGKTQKRTFEYKRMGTTDLYAALDIRTGKVITSLSQTHATPDFLRLMKKVVAEYPDQKIHVVLDNASAHMSADTEKWLAKRKGQVVFHFTPTGASWLNQIEIWNGILTRKLIRCGTFSSVKVLNREIESFVAHWNSDCGPINWTVSAEEILDKVRAITSRMESLLRATEIDDVARQAA